MTYNNGQAFTFSPGDKVICNGYFGRVIRMYSPGMVEVRLRAGEVCVAANYPDCYPVEDHPERTKQAYSLIWRHTHRDFKGKVDGVKTIMVFRNGSQLVTLDGLTDEEFTRALASAQRSEARRHTTEMHHAAS